MQEQHNSEEITDQEVSEFDRIFKEAVELDVHIPSWVLKGHANLYKFAYLQIKGSVAHQGFSSAKRRDAIVRLMNMYQDKIVDNAFEKEAPEKLDSVSDLKETPKHCAVVI